MPTPRSTSAASCDLLSACLACLGLAPLILLGVSRLVPLISSVLARVVELAERVPLSHDPGL